VKTYQDVARQISEGLLSGDLLGAGDAPPRHWGGWGDAGWRWLARIPVLATTAILVVAGHILWYGGPVSPPRQPSMA
jgi:hypothetical protein